MGSQPARAARDDSFDPGVTPLWKGLDELVSMTKDVLRGIGEFPEGVVICRELLRRLEIEITEGDSVTAEELASDTSGPVVERLEGEGQADYRKRYNREWQRARRVRRNADGR